jgi:hypothetical protein
MGGWEPTHTGPVFSKWNPAVKDGDKSKPPIHPEHLRVFFFAQSVVQFINEDSKY